MPICQLSAIKANYRHPSPPHPVWRAAQWECVFMHVPLFQLTWEVAPRLKMLSGSQSAPIRAISSRLKIGRHPTAPIGEFADRAEWRETKGADLQREGPSDGLPFQHPPFGRNSPMGGGSQIRRTTSPAPPSDAVTDGNGNSGRGLSGTWCLGPLPPFPIFVRSSSAFLPMSCLKIPDTGPEF